MGSDQNDNTEKYGEDTSHMPVKVKNVAPKFQRGLQVTKSPRNNRHVTVSGTFTDPAPEDTHTVRVAWGQEANPFVYPDQCTVNGHQFTCQHLYPGSSNGPFTIKLKVADDDGGEATTSAQVEFP